MRLLRHLAALIAIGLCRFLPTAAAGETIGPGTRLDILTVGKTSYRDVVIRSVNVRTVMITHAGGMTSVRLRDLSPELQARFNYDPAAEAAADEATRNAPRPPTPRKKAPPAKEPSAFDALLRKFGKPATIRPEVDLRPQFFKLELGVKNQGIRPSCAVFAVVSALEFQNAGLTGRVDKFSEEYLIWATRKSVRRMPAPGVAAPTTGEEGGEYRDEGFSLAEVVDALRAYGIPLQSTMPNTFGRSMGSIDEPPEAVVREARGHQHVFAHQVPGRDRATLLNNIVQALNSEVPVAVGMGWPATRVVNGYINRQKSYPGGGHAVTLVGYKSPTGRIEDAYFIFKNSWGPGWGQGGYGTVTYGYLNDNLHDAVLLEIQPG